MTYKVIKSMTASKFEVIEISTESVIVSCERHDDAYRIYKHLKKGGGFSGFTPNFFLTSFKKAVEVDK